MFRIPVYSPWDSLGFNINHAVGWKENLTVGEPQLETQSCRLTFPTHSLDFTFVSDLTVDSSSADSTYSGNSQIPSFFSFFSKL